MMRVSKYIVIIALSFYSFGSRAQDDGNTLTLEEFYQLVGDFHPVAQQAILLQARGELAVKQARGQFDPKLKSQFNNKEYGGKDYYSLWNSYLEMPTLLNVDLKAGYERNNGTYLNPEHNVPTDGLYYAGISVPLGQGLIHNPRKINLQKSRFEEQQFINESVLVMNNLLFDANYAYWWWFEYFQKYSVIENSLTLMLERYDGIKQSVANGESAAIDSVETLIQVQKWRNSYRDTELSLQNSSLYMSNYIWSDSLDIAYFHPSTTAPLTTPDYVEIEDQILAAHPELKKLSIKNEMLELDRKLSVEQIKPVLDVNYNFLLYQQDDEYNNYFNNNYKVGVEFEFPLLIRKERAKLQATKLKIQENEYKIDEKTRQTLNKVRQSYNKVLTLRQMIDQQEQILANYQRLLRAEQTKFENGESSVFLLNSRENKKLESELKLIELRAKYGQSIGELKWAAGVLHQEVSVVSSEE
ncbi:TolC family protein [Reichenbachiella ulvae]|uniref:TolC family protein n=1 Tax=Reichenbachiella ulvae TaxID=2980104 RepID=A0ABT3CU47_9BACT|nr:TolC family protein [Reichenbachiella ulvae]MCV9387198.1 TolC family protein [Reichenbachiella ulvae]